MSAMTGERWHCSGEHASPAEGGVWQENDNALLPQCMYLSCPFRAPVGTAVGRCGWRIAPCGQSQPWMASGNSFSRFVAVTIALVNATIYHTVLKRKGVGLY